MDFRRIILYFALALVGVGLWNAWERDYPSVKVTSSPTEINAESPPKPGEYTPPSFDVSTTPPQPGVVKTTTLSPSSENAATSPMISVKTDVLNIQINLQGGHLASASLPHFPVSISEKNNPVQILSNDPNNIYIAQSGITNTQQSSKAILFNSPQNNYVLNPGKNQLDVVLTGKTVNGLSITKTFTFKRNDYAVYTRLEVKNTSNQIWSGSFYHQIVRKNIPQTKGFHSRAYIGAAISSPDKPYQQITFKNMDQSDLSSNIRNGWVAMQQQYFLTAWVPQQGTINHYYSQVTPDTNGGSSNIYTIGFVTPKVTLHAGETAGTQSTFYVGPENEKRLGQIAKGLDLTIDYGWLWPISKLLFWVMDHIHSIIGNWGWSIVLVTLLIKIVFYPFSNKSFKSMMKMRALQPKIEALKERYKGDKQGQSKAMMELYRKEKVNPMGGCLPMVIQIPVFIALYYVLISSVELRQAPFILWIHDLSVKDPYYVLPILMGLSMVLQQKMSPQTLADPMQAKMMMLMPVFFTVFLLSFPSGLVLYWLTNNLLTVLQQWIVMKTHILDDGKKPVKKLKHAK